MDNITKIYYKTTKISKHLHKINISLIILFIYYKKNQNRIHRSYKKAQTQNRNFPNKPIFFYNIKIQIKITKNQITCLKNIIKIPKHIFGNRIRVELLGLHLHPNIIDNCTRILKNVLAIFDIWIHTRLPYLHVHRLVNMQTIIFIHYIIIYSIIIIVCARTHVELLNLRIFSLGHYRSITIIKNTRTRWELLVWEVKFSFRATNTKSFTVISTGSIFGS